MLVRSALVRNGHSTCDRGSDWTDVFGGGLQPAEELPRRRAQGLPVEAGGDRRLQSSPDGTAGYSAGGLLHGCAPERRFRYPGWRGLWSTSVSYTHLTLPTIYSV